MHLQVAVVVVNLRKKSGYFRSLQKHYCAIQTFIFFCFHDQVHVPYRNVYGSAFWCTDDSCLQTCGRKTRALYILVTVQLHRGGEGEGVGDWCW